MLDRSDLLHSPCTRDAQPDRGMVLVTIILLLFLLNAGRLDCCSHDSIFAAVASICLDLEP